MFFCPFCSTLLLVVPQVEGNALVCATCRYEYTVTSAEGRVPANALGEPTLTIHHSFVAHNRQLMDAEDDGPDSGAAANAASSPTTAPAGAVAAEEDASAVAGASASAEGGQVMTIPCQNEDSPCDSTKAYYIQIQMRSADEPATVFFKCVKCGHQWRQD